MHTLILRVTGVLVLRLDGSMKKKWVWWWMIAVFLAVDQISKALIVHYISPLDSVRVFPGLNLVLVFNFGSAFGFLNQIGSVWNQWFFTLFSALVSIVLVRWMRRIPPREKWQLGALSCIVSGALGNMIDRLRFGCVIDFIDINFHTYHWFVFNFADSVICVGAVILFLTTQPQRSNAKSR